MQVTLAHIGSAAGSNDPFESAVATYLKRCVTVGKFSSESFRTEKALLEWLERQRGRTPVVILMLDSRGRTMTSEALAEWLGKRRDEGTQHVVFAIGPADGWSEAARAQAKQSGGLLSLSSMTFAHAIARLVMAEQLYRACTILTGHPYHKGH